MIFEVFNQNSKYYKEMMNIILKAKNNPPEKGQLHHIIPRCWFKHFHQEIDNSISNTVLLTYEDHKLVHQLAYKCAKESWFRSKLAYACHVFGDNEPTIIHSEETKRKMSESHKGKGIGNKNFSGHKHTEEYKKKMSEILKGRTFSAETIEKMRKAKLGKKQNITPEGLERKRQATIKYNKTRILSEESRKKMSESLKEHYRKKKEMEKNNDSL